MKLLGLIFILLGCSMGGFVLAANFKRREVQLKGLNRALIELQNNIIYTHEPLPIALKNVSKKSNGFVKDLFLKCGEILDNGLVNSVYEAMGMAMETCKADNGLKKEDNEILLDFCKSLGTTDKEGHVRLFKLCLSNIEENIKTAKEDRFKNEKMYRCLGVALGLIILILFI